MGNFYFDLIKYDSSDHHGEICAIILDDEELKIERIFDGMYKVMEVEWDSRSQYIKGEWDEETQYLIRDDYLSGMMLEVNMEFDRINKQLQKEHDFLPDADVILEKVKKNKGYQKKLSETLNMEVDKFYGIGEFYESKEKASKSSIDDNDYEKMVMHALRNGQGDKLGY